MRNFHEQRNTQLKAIINRANERVSLFQIQKVVSFVQFSNKTETHVKFSYDLCNSF